MRMKGSVEIFAVLGTFTFSVILDRNNVWFQKLSILPPWKGFFLRLPTPLEIPVKLHTLTSIFGPLITPNPQGNSSPFCGGMDIF